MFNPIVVVIKMSKMGHFRYFLLMTANKSQLWQNIRVDLNYLELFQKMVWLIGLGVTVREILRVKI